MKKMVYALIPGLIFTAELVIKNRVEKNRDEKEEKPVLGGRILLRKYHNRGACLNLGEKRKGAVAVLSLLLTLALTAVFLLTLGKKGNGWLRAGLALLLGGAYSNTYDRLKRKYVVDYFSFNVGWEPLQRVVFNLADFCILTGALLVTLKGL